MARSHDRDVEQLTEDWIGVEKATDPVAWQAWWDFRREHLNAMVEPKAFTVPTEFPPTTAGAIKEYIAIVRQVRASIGWKPARKRGEVVPFASPKPS